MSQFSIACLQLELSGNDNFEHLAEQLKLTKQRYPWIDMLVLSELCIDGPAKMHAQTFPSQAETQFCQLAEQLELWLIPGSQFERDGEHIYNTASVINPQGQVVSRYRKAFPFLPYETGVTPGKDFVVFDVPQGRIGLAICYDLWFPEVARELIYRGAEVLIYPTMTGTIDRDAELILTQATAITNQCYVLSVNGAGDHGNGKSIAVDPEGAIIHQAAASKQILPIEVDFARVRRTRERGFLGLGQPLKSLRDSQLSFGGSQPKARADSELQHLGPLTVPQGSKSKQ